MMNISRKQITDLARRIGTPDRPYLASLDLIADAFGFPNQATMMAVLNRQTSPVTADLSSGTISDWAENDDAFVKGGSCLPPVAFKIRQDGPASLDVHVGGSENNGTAAGSSSVRIERRGNITRFMLYDACCDAPRIMDIPDDGPMSEAPSDWQSLPREEDEAAPQAPGI